MTSHRVARLGSELRRELSAILNQQIKDPGLGMVSVVAVDMAPDGCSAHVYVSPLISGADEQALVAALERIKGYVRRELGTRLKTRAIPELYFHADSSIAYGVRMSHVIEQQIAADQQSAAGRPPEEPGKYKE